MPIALKLSVVSGRCKDKTEPSVAYKFEPSEEYTHRELFVFYAYLMSLVRTVERMMDETIDMKDE